MKGMNLDQKELTVYVNPIYNRLPGKSSDSRTTGKLTFYIKNQHYDQDFVVGNGDYESLNSESEYVTRRGRRPVLSVLRKGGMEETEERGED